MSNLVKRLRETVNGFRIPMAQDAREAADVIERLTSQVTALREALDTAGTIFQEACDFAIQSVADEADADKAAGVLRSQVQQRVDALNAILADAQAAAEAFVRDKRIEGAEAMFDAIYEAEHHTGEEWPKDPAAVVDAKFGGTR